MTFQFFSISLLKRIIVQPFITFEVKYNWATTVENSSYEYLVVWEGGGGVIMG